MRSYQTLSRVMFVIAAAHLGACFDDSTGNTSAAVGGGSGSAGSSDHLSGAIFTSTVDGSRVNANIYAAKTDVYLDGGPGNNAPSSAAALPEGDYYFQVTDPSGKTLLSTDAIECREIHINAAGVIDLVYPGPNCQHAQGVDSDHAALGAITVQLVPYLDTPNNGGEYKAWVTPVADYDAAKGVHGFIHNASKTDNFKINVPGTDEPPPPPHPACGDGHLDAGEQCDDGNVGSGDGCSYVCTTETPPPPAPCCGDGHVDAGEQCDDGNTTSGDGCSASCTAEIPPPPPPTSCCGDGHVDAGEQCDDGNTTGGDGCSSVCGLEDIGGGPTDVVCSNCSTSMTRY
jgi:cysteine-rich repeat protein